MGDFDRLNMAKNPNFAKMLKRFGEASETVVYSVRVTKINRKGKEQTRALLVTSRAIYNIKPDDYSKCKKRLDFSSIDNLTLSTKSNEFVVHVGKYEWRLKSSFREEIISSLCKAYRLLLNTELLLNFIDESCLDMDRLKAVTHSENRSADSKIDDDSTTPLIVTKKRVHLGSFDLLKIIGKGTFGKVVQVRLKETGEIYAMKIIKKKFIYETRQVENTLAERAILTAFENPFIMNLKFAFQTKSKLYLVMNFYQGGELLFHLQNQKRFTEAQARIIAAEILIALGHLHSLNFVYRDLKPENILMDNQGHVCLTDFGLAKQLDSDVEQSDTFCGTPQYIAPELIANLPHGRAVDWWSFGILLYELVCGIPPFYSDNMNDMFDKIRGAPLRFPRGLSEEIKDLIARLLVRDPTKRLGGGKGDIEEIVPHPFFAPIDWEALFQKKTVPLYTPGQTASAEDVSNFASIKEPNMESLVNDSGMNAGSGTTNFSGFTFVSNSVRNALRQASGKHED